MSKIRLLVGTRKGRSFSLRMPRELNGRSPVPTLPGGRFIT